MAQKLPTSGSVLGLDIGDARVGLAVANVIARLPRPVETLPNDAQLVNSLKTVIQRESANLLVIGVPRSLEGLETAQSQAIRAKGTEIAAGLGLEAVFVDESLSSKRADQYLADNKKSHAPQDSIAACFILEEFLGTIG